MRNSFIKLVTALLLLAAPLFGQGNLQQGISPLHRVGGIAYASAYNTWSGRIITGNSSTGTGQTIVFLPSQNLQDGTVLSPNVFAPASLSTTYLSAQAGFTPIAILDGSAEIVSTITAESVGACPSGNLGIGQGMGYCVTVTGTINNLHGQSATVASGTAGLQEALNDLFIQGVSSNPNLGGTVVIDAPWAQAVASLPGAPTAASIISAAQAYPFVYLLDNRPSAFGGQWYSMQPSTLTAISALSTDPGVTASGTGTYTNAAQYYCVTYVDWLGGESPCSGSHNVTPSGTQGLSWPTPAKTAGAVGWKLYTGVTGVATQYQVPLTSTICTLTTLETVTPACSFSSTAFSSTPGTATMLAPQAFTTNKLFPLIQSHTTFAYQPTKQPLPFQVNFGPFTATGSITGGQVGVLGTVPLPAGTFGYIGRTIRVTGQILTTTVNTATLAVDLALGPVWTTGTPTNVCTITGAFPFTSAAYNVSFSCTMTVNALSASAGTIMADGTYNGILAAGTAATVQGFGINTATAAVGSLDTTDQTWLFVILSSGTAATNPAQLADLHIEFL